MNNEKEISTAVWFLSKTFVKDADGETTREKFKQLMHDALQRKFDNHWYVDEPHRGSAFRCVSVRRGLPDDIVFDVLNQCGLRNSTTVENDFTMWIDPQHVSYKPSHSKLCVLYSDGSGSHLSPRKNLALKRETNKSHSAAGSSGNNDEASTPTTSPAGKMRLESLEDRMERRRKLNSNSPPISPPWSPSRTAHDAGIADNVQNDTDNALKTKNVIQQRTTANRSPPLARPQQYAFAPLMNMPSDWFATAAATKQQLHNQQQQQLFLLRQQQQQQRQYLAAAAAVAQQQQQQQQQQRAQGQPAQQFAMSAGDATHFSHLRSQHVRVTS